MLIPLRDNETGRALHPQCPFGVRDLWTDKCNPANRRRCKWFVCYTSTSTVERVPSGERVYTGMSYIKCRCTMPRKEPAQQTINF